MERDKNMDINWISPDMPFGLPTADEADYYLGSPKVVEAMIRSTLGKIYDTREKATAERDGTPGGGTEEDIKPLVDSLVQALLGRQNAFKVISDVWNADDPQAGIVRSVESAYGLSGYSAAETIAFPVYLLLQTAMECEDLQAAGEDWEHLIDGDIEKMVAAFTGTPFLEF